MGTQGLPHVLHITTANVSDKAGANELLEARAAQLSAVKAALVDGGYSGQPFADFVSQCLAGAAVEVAKRSELHTFAVIPKRWVVERSISWLEKCRRLWRNCERKLESSLAMLSLAFISLLLQKLEQVLRHPRLPNAWRADPRPGGRSKKPTIGSRREAYRASAAGRI